MKIRESRRFSNPKVLTDETIILGIPFKLWNQVFTGGLEKELKEVQKKMKNMGLIEHTK